MIAKFRERWEKLKESAKRKKQARAAAEMTSVVNDRIDEEPEAEAQAERDDLLAQCGVCDSISLKICLILPFPDTSCTMISVHHFIYAIRNSPRYLIRKRVRMTTYDMALLNH